MPKLHSRHKVLDGRAEVLSYERAPDIWFYREKAEVGSYRTKKIGDCSTAEEAISKALDIYAELRAEIPKPRVKVAATKRSKKVTIETSIEDHLADQQKRADAKLVGDKYVMNKRYHLRHLKDYLDSKGIQHVLDISDDTFDDYLIFRSKTTKVNQSNEVKTISQWLRWCAKNRMLKADVAALKLTPKVSIRSEDLLSNPPISPEDWRIIENHIRKVYVESARHRDRRGQYWRKCFYTFIMVAKNSGMRPKEILNLRWSDISIKDMGLRAPQSKTDKRRHYVAEISVRKTKTGEPRQVPANCGSQLKEWLEYQQWFADQYYSEGIKRVFNKDSYVFCNFNSNCEPYGCDLFQRTLRNIYRQLDLKGHWASNKPYTLYSLRSTYVDDMLLKDTPIATLSMITGHSPQILMKHYSRLDVLRKSRELTKLPIGIPHDKKQEVALW